MCTALCGVRFTFQCTALALCTQSAKEPEHTGTTASDPVPSVGTKRQGGIFEKDHSDEPSLKRGSVGIDTVSIPAPMAATAHDGAPSFKSASHVQTAGGKNVHAIIAAVPAPPPAVVAVAPPAAKEAGQKAVAVSFLSLVTRRPDPIARNTASAMAQPVVHLNDLFVGHCGIRIRVRFVYFASVKLVVCK
jgi:hypothetical protein